MEPQEQEKKVITLASAGNAIREKAPVILHYPGLWWVIGIWGVLFFGEPDIADGLVALMMSAAG